MSSEKNLRMKLKQGLHSHLSNSLIPVVHIDPMTTTTAGGVGVVGGYETSEKT